MASNLSISRAWDETREIFRRDGKLIASVALALIVLPQAVAGIVAPQGGPSESVSTSAQILMLAVMLISLIGQLSIVRLSLGPSTTVGEAIQHGLRRFPAALGALVILIIGMVLLIIPITVIWIATQGIDAESLRTGQEAAALSPLLLLIAIVVIAISVRFSLVTPVASAEHVGPLTILKRSWSLTSGNYWRLFGFIILLLIGALVLIVAASVIGSLLARMVSPTIEPFSLSALIIALAASLAQGAFSVVAAVMVTRIYAQVAGHAVEASVPSSGT